MDPVDHHAANAGLLPPADADAAPTDNPVAPPKSGGPRTPEGKAKSRRNALKHGLTARTILSEVLPPGRVADLRAELYDQLRPDSTLKRILIDNIARHVAMLELGERAELAVLRRGASELSGFHAVVSSIDDQTDAALAAAVASEAVERFTHYRGAHEKGLVSNLKILNELMARRNIAETIAPVAERRVWTEPECEAWLRDRALRGPWRCPRCGPAAANWLAARKALQCKQCRRQTGLRTGTVMAGSPLVLAIWFRAIEAVVPDKQITAAELGRLAGIGRPATALRVLHKIRDALASAERELLLAGLVPPATSV